MNIIKDPIDEMLKADAASHRDIYIDDGGFTLRVIDALPARSTVSPLIRFAIPGAFTLLAAMFVALFSGGGNFLVDAVMDIATSSVTPSAIAFTGVVAVMIVVSLAAASDH